MNLVDFLQDLVLKGWKFWNEDDRLCYRAPNEEITSSFVAQLKQYKSDILKLLRDNPGILDIYPISYGQRSLWFLWKLAPESYAYNVSFNAYIHSSVDIVAIEKAFLAFMKRHSILCTTYSERDKEIIQKIHLNQKLDFLQIDASTWSEYELKLQVNKAHRLPFDIERGPIMRIRWFSCSIEKHVLLLTIHHIACDHSSFKILSQELPELYQAEKNGVISSLPPVKKSYQDYVFWQKKVLSDIQSERSWSYWQSQLAGDLPILNLPTDRQRTPIKTYNGASTKFQLSSGIIIQLRKLAQDHAVTFYILLLATFNVLMYRYTGQEDIIIGSPTLGRSQPEFAQVFGYFVNPVILRADLSGNPSFTEFLAQVRKIVLSALTHQDYPFPLLVEKLKIKSNSSYSPIFQASFLLLNTQKLMEKSLHEREQEADGGRLNFEFIDFPQMEGQFDLALEIEDGVSSVVGNFKYNTDLFNESTIERMASHFENLLSAIAENPQQKIGEIPILSEAERHQLLFEWNQTQVDYQQDKCMHELFEAQVERTPDAVAVVFEDQQLTYRELNQKANQLAHYLQTLGVGPEVLVGICVERSVKMLVALLGIFKASGVYVPLDPTYPQQRIALILSDAQLPVLLTQSKLVAELPEYKGRVVCLDTDWGAIARQSHENPPIQLNPENLAYTIYTSGSTGVPKGAMVEHRGMLNHLYAKLLELQLTAADIVAQTASISFDISIWQSLIALLVGGRVYIVSDEAVRDPAQLLQQVEWQGISILEIVPSQLEVMLHKSNFHTGKLPKISQLRWLLLTGEALPPKLCRQWFDFYPTIPILNAYGPTECSDDVSHHPIYEAPSLEVINIPIGRAIANMRLYILDKQLQPVPIGIAGELYVGGIGVGCGYLHNPERTAQIFIPDPFAPIPGARLYKTGDLARYLSDSNVEFLGRIDHQVKIRGFRIELGEIEAVLNTHPQIQQAVVIATEDIPGNKCLVAYVVPRDETLTTNQLRKFLQQKLPEYMMPSAFVTLDSLPLTPNGKVDRKALPTPDGNPRTDEHVAPRTPSEEIIAHIFSEVLGIETVGIYDSFFELGGHSLLATQLMVKIRETFSVDLPLRLLFENTTVAELSELLLKQLIEQTENGLLEKALNEIDELSDNRVSIER